MRVLDEVVIAQQAVAQLVRVSNMVFGQQLVAQMGRL